MKFPRRSNLPNKSLWLCAFGILLLTSCQSEPVLKPEKATREIVRDALFQPFFDNVVQRPFEAGRIRQAPPGPTHSGVISRAFTASKATCALGLLHENVNLEEANQHILDIVEYYATHPEDTSFKHDSNAWSGSLFVRLVRLFGTQGELAAGRLSEEAEKALLGLMWEWANVHSQVAKTQFDQSVEWRIHESENHDAQRYMPMWGFALIFKEHPDYRNRRYSDGYTPAEHYAAWTDYFKDYLTERARRGLFIEIATNFYSIHTLKGIYDFVDFSPDPILRERGRMLLDLFWATWAEEQIDGIRGGSKARLYQGPCSEQVANDYMRTLGWYYFRIGQSVWVPWDVINVGYAGFMCAATSQYRPHPIVHSIAVERPIPVYEIRQRRMGLAKDGFYRNPDYRLPTDFGGILRYSYVTPEFIMGTPMMEARPSEDWTLISSQNRWQGVIFSGHPHARIFPQALSTSRPTYNDQWSVQAKGALLAQKLKTATNTQGMRIWVASVLPNRVERDGWIFVEAEGAYAGIYVLHGGYHWANGNASNSNWIHLNERYSPMVFQVARKVDFDSFEAFQEQLIKRTPASNDFGVIFTSLEGDTLELDPQQRALPRINGDPIDLAPPFTFQSPHLNNRWPEARIHLSNGTESVLLDFEE